MMPASDCLPEEASLLTEGGGIRLSLDGGNGRILVADGSLGETTTVETEHGQVTVSSRGEASKPTIVAFHDLGLNHTANFQSLFQYPEMAGLNTSFRVICINAIGQEENAPNLTAGYVYPTMDQLAETVESVRTHLGLRTFIGLGVGMGANVLCRYALTHPDNVDALVVLNPSASAPGWIEWGYQKLNIRHLRSDHMTTHIVDYLLWHHFGKIEQCNQDVVAMFKTHFERHVNAHNLGLLVQAYIQRTDLGIVRELDPNKKKECRMLRCPVLNITSNFSAHIDDSVAFNARLDPSNSSWMKVQDCGMVLEEQPGKIVEAVRLFLQGLGYAVGSSRRASCVGGQGV